MSSPHEPVRRNFLRAAGAAGLAVPYLVSSSALAQPGRPGANERLSIALIGCGGMGRANLNACAGQPDVVVTGACDVWPQRRDSARKWRNSQPHFRDEYARPAIVRG